MPQVMKNIMEALKDAKEGGFLILDRDDEGMDGRMGSVFLKDRVISFLQGFGFDIELSSSPREWYSMLVKDPISGRKIPCNITISGGGSDNFTNKRAVVYSCTNLEKEEIPKTMSYDEMFQLVKDNLKEERDRSKEYYMIFLHKMRPFVLVRSLCDIKYLRANPSNPIQIEWLKEVKHRAPLSFLYDSPHEVFERFRGVLAKSYDGIQRRMKVVKNPIRSI